jgi:endonuclease/exonuclease/phosphatase (EEP) superfamily protein YafD
MGRLLVAALVGCCATLVLAPDVAGLERFAPFAELLALRPLAAVGLLLVAAGTVAVRPGWWPSAAALGTIALAAVAFVLVSRVVPASSAAPDPAPGQPTLSVLAFNVFDGQADVAALGGTIRAERPDLVVLPEAGEPYRRLLLAEVGDLGYRSWTTVHPQDPDVEGIVVLAAPAMGSLEARVLDDTTKFAWLELTGGRLGTARLVAVHTAAPISGLVTEWHADLTALRAWCRPPATPVVLAGDFNATLDHRGLRSLGCTDVAAAAGRGLTGTWPTSLPAWLGVQIDHVLTGGGVTPAGARVLDLPGSDHRAVLARVTLPGVPTAGTPQ